MNTLVLRRRGVRRKASRSDLLAGPWHYKDQHLHPHQDQQRDQQTSCLSVMPSPGLQMLSNGTNGNAASRMDGTLSQSMDSVNTVAAEEEVSASPHSYYTLLG